MNTRISKSSVNKHGSFEQAQIWNNEIPCQLRCKSCWDNKHSSKTKIYKNLKRLWLHTNKCFDFKNSLTEFERKRTMEIFSEVNIKLSNGENIETISELENYVVYVKLKVIA